MFSFLKQPFPCTYGHKSNFTSAVLTGIFVSIFLLTFKPFGIAEDQEEYFMVKNAGFGAVTFIVLLFIYFVLPKIFTNFFKEKDYTVQRELVISVVIVLLIGIANSIYGSLIIEKWDDNSILITLWNTFLVAIFPLSFLTLIQYNRLLKSNVQASQEIKLPDSSSETKSLNLVAVQNYIISSDQDKAEINLDHILFLESEGNYAHLHQSIDNTYSKITFRTTLKSLEEENSYPNIIRCHRSYIINLDQVSEVSGNAQGLKLQLKNYSEEVPVSRKYIQDVKNYFDPLKQA